MTVGRALILLTILIGGGVAFAVQFASKSDGNLNADPLYGHVFFGGAGLGHRSTGSDTSLNPDANALNKPSGITSAVRANLIVVGRDIFFDENNNRQPEPAERLSKQGNPVDVSSADGRSRYRMTKASLGLDSEFVSNGRPQSVILQVDILDPAQPESVILRQSGKINVYPEPADHGWAHFDGPLLMEFIGENVKLPASGGPTVELRLAVFTPSVPCSTNKEEKALRSNSTALVPGLIFPTVTIEFPSTTGEPIIRRYDMDQFC